MDTRPIAQPDARMLVRARIAVSIAFLVMGTGAGLWGVHIPVVAERLGLAPATIGLGLLCAATGAVLNMPLTGAALTRLSSRPPTAALTLAFAVLTPFPILAPWPWFLFVSLFLWGAAMGGLDVAMNTQATEVEAARRKPTMSSFHGFFSVGALIGSSLGGLIVGSGWGDGRGALIVAAVLLVAGIWSAFNLWPSAPPDHAGPRFTLPPAAVLGIGAITLLAFAGEGAVSDWSALFLSKVKGTSAGVAASGLIVFSVAMIVCRLTGDRVVAALGATTIVFAGGLLMAAGIAIAVVAPWPIVSALGFGIVGIGAANLAPVGFSAASRTPGVPASVGVAAVTTMGYAGFLVSPPTLGFVANAWGLPVALGIVAVMGLAITALTGAVRR
ncbi:MAG TPA: MFS transporter [Bauldia sp.]|nr:MFS transporter [Bauldia sp.]